MARGKNLNRMIYRDRKDNRIARQVARKVTTTLEKRKIVGYSVTLMAGRVIVTLPDDLEDTRRETLISAIFGTRHSELIDIGDGERRTKNALDDDEIQEHFSDLIQRYLPKEKKISGIAESGTLTLIGRISNARAKEAVLDLAQQTPGVSRIIDKMRIPFTVGDVDLANAVIYDLGNNRNIKVYHLQVFAKSGHVFLSGNTSEQDSIALAEKLAGKVAGVKSVTCSIRLHGTGETEDDKLEKAVCSEIKKSTGIRARDINVAVIGCHVFLRGYAKDTGEIISAEKLVSSIPGVKKVYMELEPRL